MKVSVSANDAIWQQHLANGFQQVCRRWMIQVLERFMKVERTLFLGCLPYERNACRRGSRNGYEPRWLETKWGSLRLRVPRVRNTAQPFRTTLFDRYRRYRPEVEEAIRTWAACGMSTRQVAQTVGEVLGATLSAATVTRVIAELDEELAAFHRRPFQRGYRYLFLDAKHGYIKTYRRRRGRKRPTVLLLAWGIDHGGKEELVDFRVAPSESEASWTEFLTYLEARGLCAENRWAEKLEMIVSDDHAGIGSALAMVYPGVPHQLCVLHKLKNIADHLRDRKHRKAILAEASAIYRHVLDASQARARQRRWARKWGDIEPEAVENFSADFELTLRYLTAAPRFRGRVKTNNPVERFIREINRKFRQMGAFANEQSWERATYLVWRHLKLRGYPNSIKNLFTRNS